MRKINCYINGEWVETEKSFDIISPRTEQPIAIASLAEDQEINNAIKNAIKAFDDWSSRPLRERAEIIKKASDILIDLYGEEGKSSELKKRIMEEVGKPLPEADIEVIESSDIMAFYAEIAESQLSTEQLSFNSDLWPTKQGEIIFEPKGVIAIIKAWNYPLEIPVWSLAPALIAGNTVIFKPSEHSPGVGMELVRVFEQAGLPKGVLNFLPGDRTTGQKLIQDDRISMVDFTGSVGAGKHIAQICSQNLKHYSLELGGNDAAIIDQTVHSELAANGVVWGAFCNAGQVCVGVKRAFIHETVFTNILNKIIEKTNNLIVDRDYGPLISLNQLEKIEEFIQDATSKGAKILTGGKRVAGRTGYYFEPTVLANVNRDMNIMNTECFGPLLPVMKVKNIEEAITLSNNSNYGLGASIWTADNESGRKVAQKLNVGMVWINDVNVAFPEAPWGGIKHSGSGLALSRYSLYEYVNRKHVCYESSNDERRKWWYPYPSVDE